MNESIVLIDLIVKIIMKIEIICAIGVLIYYRERLLEALEKIARRYGQPSQDEEGLAFVNRHDGHVDRELR